MSVCGITRPLGRLSPADRQIAHVLRTRSPVALAGPRDLHVLSTPPAFVLSQDQTLQWLETLISSPKNAVTLSRDSVFGITRMFSGCLSRRTPEWIRVKKIASHTLLISRSIIKKRVWLAAFCGSLL